MVEKKKGKIMSVHGGFSAQLDDNAIVTLNGDAFNKTVRVTSCELVSNTQKCNSCKSYRASLRAIFHKWKKRCSLESTDLSKHTNEREPEHSREDVNAETGSYFLREDDFKAKRANCETE